LLAVCPAVLFACAVGMHLALRAYTRPASVLDPVTAADAR
jgi:hypothetical protein